MDVKPLVGYGVPKGAGGNAVGAQDLGGVEGVSRRAGQHLRVRRQRGVLRRAEQARAHLQLAAGVVNGRLAFSAMRAASSETVLPIAGKQWLQLLAKKVWCILRSTRT